MDLLRKMQRNGFYTLRTTHYASLIIALLLLTINIVCFAQENQKDDKTGKITHYLESKNIPNELIVTSIATLPIFELRGAIPIGINYYKIHWLKTYMLAVVGNMIPIIFVLLFLKYITKVLYPIPIFKRFFDWLFARTRKKGKIIEKYEEIGLIIFVMIPLPVTGAWTGSIAAYLFGINFFTSLLCIFIGVCLAGIIVTTLSLLGIWGAVIATIVLSFLFISWLYRYIKGRKR